MGKTSDPNDGKLHSQPVGQQPVTKSSSKLVQTGVQTVQLSSLSRLSEDHQQVGQVNPANGCPLERLPPSPPAAAFWIPMESNLINPVQGEEASQGPVPKPRSLRRDTFSRADATYSCLQNNYANHGEPVVVGPSGHQVNSNSSGHNCFNHLPNRRTSQQRTTMESEDTSENTPLINCEGTVISGVNSQADNRPSTPPPSYDEVLSIEEEVDQEGNVSVAFGTV